MNGQGWRRSGRQRSHVLVIAATLVGASLMGACGGSDEDEIRDTVDTYLHAVAKGDGQTACAQLNGEGEGELIAGTARQLPAQLATTDCAEIIALLSGALSQNERDLLRDALIDEIVVSGDKASVSVIGASVEPRLVESDGSWLISSGLSGR